MIALLIIMMSARNHYKIAIKVLNVKKLLKGLPTGINIYIFVMSELVDSCKVSVTLQLIYWRLRTYTKKIKNYATIVYVHILM